MNKRGISAIIVMVLIILITVAAVTIIWASVIPVINTQLKLAEDCRKATASIKIDTSCTTLENITMTVSRKSDEFNLVDLQFGGGYVGGSDAAYLLSEFKYPESSLPKPNEMKTFSINITMALTPTIINLKVAPVLREGKKKRTCDPSPKVKTPWCNNTWNKIAPKPEF